MENLLDPSNQVETEPPEAAQATAAPETVETEAAPQPPAEESGTSAAPQVIEEIDTAPKTQAAKAVTKPAEPPPNPLLLDPYEWDQCTITVGYSLLPDRKVSVSVHNHQDEPIVREFPLEEVPLPTKISSVMAALQGIWPASPVNAAVVLLPKPGNAPERPIIASVRVSTDTPIVQAGVEADLPFPAPIAAMLEELKALMPDRALKNIGKNARAKSDTTVKPANKSAASRPAASASPAGASKNVQQDQMTLF